MIVLLGGLVATALGLCAVARAEIYDDFGANGIDTGKWVRSSDPAFSSRRDPRLFSGDEAVFSQSNGRLHFPCKYGASESLVSTRSFPPGFVRLEFHDYTSTNYAPSGRGLGSYVSIMLGAGDEYVRTLRGNVASTGYFEANHITGGRLVLGLDPSDGWQRVGPSVTPQWASSPNLYVRGNAGGSGCTSFSVDNVEFTPAPLPASLLKALR